MWLMLWLNFQKRLVAKLFQYFLYPDNPLFTWLMPPCPFSFSHGLPLILCKTPTRPPTLSSSSWSFLHYTLERKRWNNVSIQGQSTMCNYKEVKFEMTSSSCMALATLQLLLMRVNVIHRTYSSLQKNRTFVFPRLLCKYVFQRDHASYQTV